MVSPDHDTLLGVVSHSSHTLHQEIALTQAKSSHKPLSCDTRRPDYDQGVEDN